MINREKIKPIKVTKGVLQEKSASPLLYNLYMNDLAEYLKANKIPGITINNQKNLSCLYYADDLVILANTPIMAQKSLNAMSFYSKQ